MQPIYLDHNATTPLDPAVLDAMLPYLRESFGNASSAHHYGITARSAIETARVHVSALVGTSPECVVFTGSATEAINAALRTTPRRTRSARVVLSAVEHDAVIRSAELLQAEGCDIVLVPVDADGDLNVDALDRAITTDTELVCVMWVNNETGVVSPISDVAAMCSTRGVLLFVDAVQAAGRLPISMQAAGIDLLAISAHKIFGPKGVGALIASNSPALRPFLVGGDQENGLRAGTENVAGIVGLGEAARLARIELASRNSSCAPLRDRLESSILQRISGAIVNGGRAGRVSNTSNVSFRGIDADILVALLDAAGVCASTGSACHAASLAPSHVILAMTGSNDRANEAIRFSLSHLNTIEEIDCAVDQLATIAETVRRNSTAA